MKEEYVASLCMTPRSDGSYIRTIQVWPRFACAEGPLLTLTGDEATKLAALLQGAASDIGRVMVGATEGSDASHPASWRDLVDTAMRAQRAGHNVAGTIYDPQTGITTRISETKDQK